MKHYLLYSLIIFVLLSYNAKAQNIECIGNTIEIELNDYKGGSIQWQFSTNNVDWTDLADENDTILTYVVIETGYFRAKVTYGDCYYFSNTTYIEAALQPTKANAGIDQTIFNDDSLVTLSANMPSIGTGKWTFISGDNIGSFADETSPTTTYTGRQCSNYYLCWTISTACNSSSDYLSISFRAKPTPPNAGIDQTILNDDSLVTLSANVPIVGTGKWTIFSGGIGSFADETSPTTTFTISQCNDYVLRWTISTKCKSYSNDVSIYILPQPTKAKAGIDKIIFGTDTIVTLSANVPIIGKGKWTIVSGGTGSFADETSPTTTFTSSQCSDYVLRWTISTICKSSSDDVNIYFNPANAGPDQSNTKGDTIVTLSANIPIVGTGKWTIVSEGIGSFADENSPTTTFTGSPLTHFLLRWTTTSCKSSWDDVNIDFHPDTLEIDNDNNIYHTVTIGKQTWMKENLKTTKYSDGTAIASAKDNTELENTEGLYCWYKNDSVTYKPDYGALYNWYAVNPDLNGGKHICPSGWHVPSFDEWGTLMTDFKSGGLMKEIGTTHWASPNEGANNNSGFTGLPGGMTDLKGNFSRMGKNGHWWTSTKYPECCNPVPSAYGFNLYYQWPLLDYNRWLAFQGISVRCIADNVANTGD